MSLVKIQFLEDGEWGDHPADPIFKVKAGETREVSAGFANDAVDAGKARFLDSQKEIDIKSEVAEDKRVEMIQIKIQSFNLQEILGDELNSGPLDSNQLNELLEFLESVEIDDSFEEFESKALDMKDASIETLVKRIERADKDEVDAAELEEFRREKAESGVEKAEAGPTEKAEAPEAGPKAKAEGKPAKGKGKKS